MIKRARLSKNVKNLLEKSKESAKLAIQVYNTPDSKFRVGSFIVLMMIAWTSLLHAIFEKNKIDYYYLDTSKTTIKKKEYIKKDGETQARSLIDSIKEYFPQNSPISSNIEFFIKIRNKIEHRFMPNVINSIVGQCQALIINYEKILISEFGQKNSLSEYLFVPIQISEFQRQAIPSRDEQKVLKFLTEHRSKISNDILNSPEFSYGLYLIPKVANHQNENTPAIEFIRFDKSNLAEMEKYQHMIVAIKEKQVSVANGDKFRPNAVIQKIIDRGYSKNDLIDKNVKGLGVSWHTSMRKKYNIRKKLGDADTVTKYCQLDTASTTQDFVYTQDWIDFLIDKEFSKKNS